MGESRAGHRFSRESSGGASLEKKESKISSPNEQQSLSNTFQIHHVAITEAARMDYLKNIKNHIQLDHGLSADRMIQT